MNRRRLLGTIALAAGWLAFRPGWAWSAYGATPEHSLARRLVEVFRRRQSAVAIGRAYIRGVAEAPRVEGLLQEVVADLDPPANELRRAPQPVLRQTLHARIRQDFAEGQTVRVDGWVLSRTEAKLCGLAALLEA
jgi:hypothetical protein